MICWHRLWWCGSRRNRRFGTARRRISRSIGVVCKVNRQLGLHGGRAGTLARWWGQARRVRGRVGLSDYGGLMSWRTASWGLPGVVPVGLGDGIEAPLEANDGDGEVGEAGEIARQVAGSHPATVFVVGDVAHVVESIFDAPVPAHQSEDDLARWPGRGAREVRPCTVSCSTSPVLTMRRSRSMRKATWR